MSYGRELVARLAGKSGDAERVRVLNLLLARDSYHIEFGGYLTNHVKHQASVFLGQ